MNIEEEEESYSEKNENILEDNFDGNELIFENNIASIMKKDKR